MIVHVVKKGESLMEICHKYGITLNQLKAANTGTNCLTVAGLKLNIPVLERIFNPGDIIKHFKRDLELFEDPYNTKYLYKVLAIAKHTETEEDMLVYQAMYPPFGVFVRPMSMVNEKVPLERYSDSDKAKIKNTYRLELYNGF